jgi:nucleotide-binding universal stress UspA family protein
VAPGTTGEHLLHGAPCPVAVVPRGHAVSSRTRISRVGVGIDGGPESAAALAAAARIAEAFDAELEVIRAYTPGGLPPDAALARDLAVHAQRQLADALAVLGPTVAAYPMLIDEPPARALTDRSRDLDLLVVGSRGYGPTRSVLLGGVSGRLIRRAACPVVVLPRGARTPLETLFPTRVATPAR